MENFQIIKNFLSKKGTSVSIRYPKMEDLDEFLRYINKLSKEDTYIGFSGEEISREDEEKFLTETFQKMEKGDGVLVIACAGNTIIGICHIDRRMDHRKRGMHIGIFGLSIEKEYRGQGIGRELALSTIEEAKKNIQGLRIVDLIAFGINKTALDLYNKIGFREYGRLHEGVLYKGEYSDEVMMALHLI